MKFGSQIENNEEMENLKNFSHLVQKLLEEQKQLKLELNMIAQSEPQINRRKKITAN